MNFDGILFSCVVVVDGVIIVIVFGGMFFYSYLWSNNINFFNFFNFFVGIYILILIDSKDC